MHTKRTLVGGALVLASLAGTAAIATPASAAEALPAAVACHDGVDPSLFSGTAQTPRATILFGRTIQLRYNTNHCVWGRILNGSVGDQVWVDRSLDLGSTWQSKRASATITSGTSAYTFALNDLGVVSRACGKAGNRPDIACTDWY
jgi:hypothetical protein